MEDKNKNLRSAALVTGAVMTIIYLSAGLVLLLTPAFEAELGKNKTIIAVVVLLYGVFRAFTTYKLKKTHDRFKNSNQ